MDYEIIIFPYINLGLVTAQAELCGIFLGEPRLERAGVLLRRAAFVHDFKDCSLVSDLVLSLGGTVGNTWPSDWRYDPDEL